MTLLAFFLVYALVLSLALGRAGFRSNSEAHGTAELRQRPAKILIIGATGGTGRQLVSQALEQGYEVTAFVRNPARLDVSHPRLTLAQGDVIDVESVSAAVRGQEAVISALGHKRFFYPTRILSRGTNNILRAMEQHGVRQFICQTSLGIGDSAGRMGLYYTLFVIPCILPFYFWDKTRQERAIAASDREWIIVRPAALNNRGARHQVRHGPGIGNYLVTVKVSRADVAEFVLDQLDASSYLRSAPGVSW